MKGYDWIVVGNGLAGAAVSYELAKVGFSVLVLERSPQPESATRFSYGGIAYWSGTTPLTRQLCQEGIDLHRSLSAELENNTDFRQRHLLLTIDVDRDPAAVAATYQSFAIPPTLLSPQDAATIEPHLNPSAVSGVLQLPHGHVSPLATVRAYNQALSRLGGTIQTGRVTGVVQTGDRVTGVQVGTETYAADQVLVSAGGLSRSLLATCGLTPRLYFTQAEVIETPPVDLSLQALIMPAELKRFEMEAKAGHPALDGLWNQPGQEVVPAILDSGAVQFGDRHITIGQISRTLTDPTAAVDATASEMELRRGIGRLLPALQDLPGTWRSCLVAFSSDRLPLVGEMTGKTGLYLFSGFSNPFVWLPPIARRFARHQAGSADELMAQLSPNRFENQD